MRTEIKQEFFYKSMFTNFPPQAFFQETKQNIIR